MTGGVRGDREREVTSVSGMLNLGKRVSGGEELVWQREQYSAFFSRKNRGEGGKWGFGRGLGQVSGTSSDLPCRAGGGKRSKKERETRREPTEAPDVLEVQKEERGEGFMRSIVRTLRKGTIGGSTEEGEKCGGEGPPRLIGTRRKEKAEAAK